MKMPRTKEEYFYNRVKEINGCWIWQPHKDTVTGYGVINKKWRKIFNKSLAHQFSYCLHIGTIPDKVQVLHKCDVRACCNPAHLFLGTQHDNIHDMISKGRDRKALGENVFQAKLTEEKVHIIRNTSLSASQLSRDFNVSERSIHAVRSRQTWKHI